MAADGMQGDGPSEAELQQMLAQMRESPAEQVLVEVVNVMLQAVQVKLGRPDARLLLDAVAAITECVRGRADAQLVDQVAEAVTQLRMAQVEAEGGATSAVPGPDATPAPGPAPASGPAPGPTRGAAAPSGQAGGPGGSRLWVPGR